MLGFLYNLIVYPIIVLYSLVYHIVLESLSNLQNANLEFFKENNCVFSIIAVSLIVNIITYGLYKKADEIETASRLKKQSMSEKVSHIKKTFKGDEQYFILSAYYKEQNYKPLDQFKESISLLLQIPFFAAAYIFFTKYVRLGDSYIFVTLMLSEEDGLMNIGDIVVNALPIIMTFINIISAVIYTKGLGIKDKLKSLLLPIVFLVLLYHSPSGLVIYWTMNNILSLIKIVYLKLIYPSINKQETENKTKDNIKEIILEDKSSENNMKWILISYLVFLGIVIPSLVIVASPTEFETAYYNMWSIFGFTFTVYLGITLWMYVFYSFSKHKKWFLIISFSVLIHMILNHIMYLNNLGIIENNLIYDHWVFDYTKKDMYINYVYFIVILAIVYFIQKKQSIILFISKVLCIAFIVWGLVNIVKSEIEIAQAEKSNATDKSITLVTDGTKPVFDFSKEGKNIIFLCIDRFCARYYPYALEVRPDLKEKFAGFTVYENTLSFGNNTRFASPALYGGFDYTPAELNKREDTNKEKIIEAHKVLPKMLTDEGYTVTVGIMPYQADTDLSFSDIPNVRRAEILTDEREVYLFENLSRKFVFFSLLRGSPLSLKELIYDEGIYFYQRGYLGYYSAGFVDSYKKLSMLKDISKIKNDDSKNAVILHNNLTHEPSPLTYPDFLPSYDGTEDVIREKEDLSLDDESFDGDVFHLNVTIASLIKVSELLEYLRENNVYDNTRIVIVSDHGCVYNDWDKETAIVEKNINKISKNSSAQNMAIVYPQSYNPILMYKDFGAKEYKESDELMTNADAPYLILKDISENMKNPLNGKVISMDYKNTDEPIHIFTEDWMEGQKYILGENILKATEGYWANFKGDKVFDTNNWSFDFDMQKAFCLDGRRNHTLVYKEVTKEKKCGINYLRPLYECELCHKYFKDEKGDDIIRDTKEYIEDVPHEFVNYVSDNNDSKKVHGTKTAYCEYGCNTKNTIYDEDLSMHHHFIDRINKASDTKDGSIESLCKECNIENPDIDTGIIPRIGEVIVADDGYEYLGKKVKAKIKVIDANGNDISNDNYDVEYKNNDNIGIGLAIVTFKNLYELVDDQGEKVNKEVEFKIVPKSVIIKKVEKSKSRLNISIERGQGRINQVEILINDNDSFILNKNDKDEYRINLNEVNGDVKSIKVRVIKTDNLTNESLYSPWTLYDKEVK